MDINAIQQIVAVSTSRVIWSMSLLAGSLAAILSTSYIKPVSKWAKLIYLVFIPGWCYLFISIKYGDDIVRRGIMVAITPNQISTIADKINNDFISQIDNFNIAIIFFGIWLLSYIICSTFEDFKKK